MTAVLDAPPLADLRTFRGAMEPTRTYARRWWEWIPARGLSIDGFLILGQTKEKGGEVDSQTYGVCELPSVWPGARMFVVRKLGADAGGDDEQYQTTFHPGGRGSTCTCKAGQCKTEVCRHRCGLAAVMAAGHLPKKALQGA